MEQNTEMATQVFNLRVLFLQVNPPIVILPGKFHEQKSLAGYSPGVTKSWTQQLTGLNYE